MNEPIRVLHVFMGMNRSGVPVMLMNYYRNIDRSRVQFDFAVEASEQDVFDDEIISLGGKIHKIGALTDSFKFYVRLSKIIRKNRYRIVHSHMNFRNVLILFTALLSGAKIRISHSHNSYLPHNPVLKFFSKSIIGFLNLISTHYFACSKIAGDILYGIKKSEKGKVTVINNAIDIEAFEYNPDERLKVRKSLGLKDNVVLGNVGNFLPFKNHGFMIEVFNRLLEVVPEAKLVLVGQGRLMESVREKAKSLNIEDKVLFLGCRDDVVSLYQVFDLFVLTSFNEGLPLVLIEAQASGLRCIVSDNLTEESNPADLLKILKLESSAGNWADEIQKVLKTPYERCSALEKLKIKGFDIKNEASKLEELYIGMKD